MKNGDKVTCIKSNTVAANAYASKINSGQVYTIAFVSDRGFVSLEGVRGCFDKTRFVKY